MVTGKEEMAQGGREGLIRQFAQGKAGWDELTMTQLEMGLTETEDRISEVEDKMVEINQAERKK